MRRWIPALSAAAILLASGCATGTATENGSPTAAADAHWYTKEVGEDAGALCTSSDGDRRQNCSLVFRVTEITPVARTQCNEFAEIPADSMVVRVGLDAEGLREPQAPNQGSTPGYVVSASNWSGRNSDGFATDATIAAGCGEFNPGPFYDSTKVGQKSRGTILFAIPEDSIELELSAYGHAGGWRWPLPPQQSSSSSWQETPSTAADPAETSATTTPVPAAAGSSIVQDGPCFEAEARTFGTDANGQSLVCTYMGSGGYAWVMHAPISGGVHRIGDPCDPAVDTVAQDADGRAVMCGGDTWVGGP